jgi:ArsR family transcriptional regulator, arsenate/arsenite/antimonite-responsive transcriptional repressor
MKSEDFLLESESFFMALADKTRLRLLNLMRDEEICVCFFVDVLGESQPKISRHLAYLRNAGIVKARRDGKWMHYRIVPPENETNAKILSDLLQGLQTHEKMRVDYENLVNACCSTVLPIAITGMKLPTPPIESIHIDSSSPRTELETFLL